MSAPLLPGSTIGMLGSGQLGRMSGQAARRLGYRLVVLSPEEDSPAGHIADYTVLAPLTDAGGMCEVARMSDVVTYEFENVSAEPLHDANRICDVFPHPDILHVTQHRLREKDVLRSLGIPTADYMPVRSLADLEQGLAEFEHGVLKRVTGGYDGKGQEVVRRGEDVQSVYERLSDDGRLPLILERLVPFQKELSVVVARGRDGQTVAFPCVENIHRRGILHLTIAPARVGRAVAKAAEDMACRIAKGLNLVGVMGIEMFLVNGTLLVNELAPRPHNSAHYTLDACRTSQFEQHIRAVTGLPLGSSTLHTPAAMLNLLGEHAQALFDNLAVIMSDPNVKLHWYGKTEARPGRKMGHITALGTTVDEALERLERPWHLVRSESVSLF